MKLSSKPTDLAKTIGRSSPLHNYWKSPQNDQNEQERINMSSEHFPPAMLFKKEPYKWEMLYQSIVTEITKGDYDSIKGLKLLISMLNEKEQSAIIQEFSNKKIFNSDVVERIIQTDINQSPTKQKNIRFLRILFAIFTNPYCIEIKRTKNHIYEKTGSFLFVLRRFFSPA